MLGKILAIVSVILFVSSNALFRRIDQEVTPVQINAVRTGIGAITFIIIGLIIGQFSQIFSFSGLTWLWLLLSISFGQILGDTAYFYAQKMIGTTIALSIAMTFPIFTFILSLIFFQTQFSWLFFVGMPLVIVGVIAISFGKQEDKQVLPLHPPIDAGLRWAAEHYDSSLLELSSVNEKSSPSKEVEPPVDQSDQSNTPLQKRTPKFVLIAIFIALLASVFWAVGIILTEYALHQISSLMGTQTFSSLLGNIARLPFATLVLFAFTLPQKRTKMRDWDKKVWLWLLVASIIGTSLGLYVYTESIRLAGSAFVSILGSTSPLFSIPIAWFVNRERINFIGFLGIICTIGGVIIILTI
ncbi:MAG: EamA family transporter [Candidatus Heimdallarchaeota archaeon]|nr:EamA family transporter [Candidatus Heimdallarchaeota archaeon]